MVLMSALPLITEQYCIKPARSGIFCDAAGKVHLKMETFIQANQDTTYLEGMITDAV